MPNVWPFSRARFATDDSSAELEHDFKMSQRFPPPKESALGRELTREDDPPLDSYDLERAPTTGTLDIGLPPDGGREAWLCVLSSLLVLFCIFGIGLYLLLGHGSKVPSHQFWPDGPLLPLPPAGGLLQVNCCVSLI